MEILLEQSTLHGRIFYSKIAGKAIASKPADITSIQFGPMRAVELYPLSDNEMWVQDKQRDDWYHYLGTDGNLVLDSYQKGKHAIPDTLTGNRFCYYYGLACYDNIEQLYFVQNKPVVTIDNIPDIQTIQIPLTLQKMDYEQVFHYPDEIKQFLATLPACYVDRYKRPIKTMQGRTYPISMETVKTTWKELPDTTYPVVIDFKNSPYGIVDLEPEHTKEDLEHFISIPGFYEEETVRGGKHKVVLLESDIFKFRYSPGLEIINQSQVTLYGIHGKWLTDHPQALDVTNYKTVGHIEHTPIAKLERPDITKELKLLQQKAEENLSMGKDIAKKLYANDMDTSHGEFMALWTLYEQDIAPYATQFPTELLPWILEAYASDVILHRDKHETLRNGLPYLVHLSDIIIDRKGVTKIWDR